MQRRIMACAVLIALGAAAEDEKRPLTAREQFELEWREIVAAWKDGDRRVFTVEAPRPDKDLTITGIVETRVVVEEGKKEVVSKPEIRNKEECAEKEVEIPALLAGNHWREPLPLPPEGKVAVEAEEVAVGGTKLACTRLSLEFGPADEKTTLKIWISATDRIGLVRAVMKSGEVEQLRIELTEWTK
jgi:hypothetical protein